MNKRVLLVSLLVAASVIITGCNPADPNPDPSTITLEYDFRDGKLEWTHGFAEYSPDMDIQAEAGLKPLPGELGITGEGYYIQSMNRSDDVFMFLKRQTGIDEGIVPGATYRVIYTITLASNAPTGAVGIGGPPGEAVFVKAGATPVKPEVKLETVANYEYYIMTVDKGEGNSGGGPAASEAGNIANGIPADEFDFANPTYATIVIEHEHEYNVQADDDGNLWLLVGTDSGFEGLTGIFYQNISVILEPVEN